MTPEGFKKHKHLIEAWADGAEIEVRSDETGYWRPTRPYDPTWAIEYEYRVKPTPKTVEMWVNVYPGYIGASIYTSEFDADNFVRINRIACVPVTVTYTEGEGL